MVRCAREAGLSSEVPLLLMMDNASIHKGVVVSEALKKCEKRLGVAYQPPYMPTVNPVELVNNQLKAALRKISLRKVVSELLMKVGGIEKNKNDSMDPKGGVVFDAPIDVDSKTLKEVIEWVLDEIVQKEDVAAFVGHCGWRMN